MADESLYVSAELARILAARLGGQHAAPGGTVRFVTLDDSDAVVEAGGAV